MVFGAASSVETVVVVVVFSTLSADVFSLFDVFLQVGPGDYLL